MSENNFKYNKTIRIWLLIGLIMLIGQVILGGITRLTGSGLSITRWDIVTGVVPPLNVEDWIEAFDLYKETPQFKKINTTITLSHFKFIYFWEYFHRLWVRALGFIFLIPFLFFIIKKKIDFYLVKRLGLVVFLTALTASAGWIMVKSGLINRPWVNAYKLTLHFMLALFVIWAMVKTIADVYNFNSKNSAPLKKIVPITIGITLVQMLFAGLMAGMKAGLYYTTWPDMNGSFIPDVLLNSENWNWQNMMNYDHFLFAPALVQFLHRFLAYLLVALVIYMFCKLRKRVSIPSKKWLDYSLLLIVLQLLLGILTVTHSQGKIPLYYGVGHQLIGLLFFISLLFLHYSLRKRV